MIFLCKYFINYTANHNINPFTPIGCNLLPVIISTPSVNKYNLHLVKKKKFPLNLWKIIEDILWPIVFWDGDKCSIRGPCHGSLEHLHTHTTNSYMTCQITDTQQFIKGSVNTVFTHVIFVQNRMNYRAFSLIRGATFLKGPCKPRIAWACLKITYYWIARRKSNNFLNIYYFSKACITENTQVEQVYKEKALYIWTKRKFSPLYDKTYFNLISLAVLEQQAEVNKILGYR